MSNDDHEFGSQSTELKLSIVEKYLRAYTTALKGKFLQLWYFDAFAGTGSRTVRTSARAGGLFHDPNPNASKDSGAPRELLWRFLRLLIA